MFGERRLLLDADLDVGWDRAKYSLDDVKRLNQKCRAKEATLVKALILAGATWPGDRLSGTTCARSITWSRGRRWTRSGSAAWASRWAATAPSTCPALDDRIAAGCVVGFMSSVKPMIKAHLDTHSWVHFLPGLHRWLDLPDVASLTAPRALLVQQCCQDRLFPPAGMKESVEKIAAVYKKAGAEKKFAGRFYDVPHQFTRRHAGRCVRLARQASRTHPKRMKQPLPPTPSPKRRGGQEALCLSPPLRFGEGVGGRGPGFDGRDQFC